MTDTTSLATGHRPVLSRSARPRVRRLAPGPVAWGVIGTAIVVGLWWACGAFGWISENSLPSPAATWTAGVELLGDGDFRSALLDTLWSWARSLVFASVSGVVVGLAVGWNRILARAFTLPMHLGRSIPATTLLPIAVVLFGLGTSMKVAIVSFSMFWLVIVNTIYGVRTIDPVAVRAARSMRFTRRQIVANVLLPSTLPSVMVGIRVAAGVGFVVTLSAELLGASSGIGTEMLLYQNVQRSDAVYAGVLIVSVIGMVMNYGIQAIENLLAPWRPSSRARRSS